MAHYIVVLDDGETYSSLHGCEILRITDLDDFDELETHDQTVKRGLQRGSLEFACEMEDLVDHWFVERRRPSDTT